ncbi:hypothetical protein H0H92_003854 [Tricholoma furcatifolium]|nr:hypothetical protein H0H92_003854 [Tricholoma furcatifolium]
MSMASASQHTSTLPSTSTLATSTTQQEKKAYNAHTNKLASQPGYMRSFYPYVTHTRIFIRPRYEYLMGIRPAAIYDEANGGIIAITTSLRTPSPFKFSTYAEFPQSSSDASVVASSAHPYSPILISRNVHLLMQLTSIVSASPLIQGTPTPNSSGSPEHLAQPFDPRAQEEQQTISATPQGRVCGNKACQRKIWAGATGTMCVRCRDTYQETPSKDTAAV